MPADFCLKNGVPIQKDNKVPLGPKTRGEEYRRRYTPAIQLLGLGERRELSQLGPGQSPGQKRFYCNLISADRLCWQQILHFFVLKSGVQYHQSKKWGTLCLCMPTCPQFLLLWYWVTPYCKPACRKYCNSRVWACPCGTLAQEFGNNGDIMGRNTYQMKCPNALAPAVCRHVCKQTYTVYIHESTGAVWSICSLVQWFLSCVNALVTFRVATQPGKSWNLRREFFRHGKSWKMTVVVKSCWIPPIGRGIF